MRRYRFALRPGWVALHVVCVALIVTMVLLGRWQLDVSNSKHFSLQNFGYALQWWAFSIFVLVMWARVMRDTARRLRGGSSGEVAATQTTQVAPGSPAEQPVAYRRYVMPSTQSQVAPVDDTHAAYNAYLAGLAQRDTEGTA